jgi:CheY-like chemotaxis protein
MGSELKVKSEYQIGSEFYFDIKQKISNIEPIGDFREKLLMMEEKEDYQNSYIAPEARVLVVDDDSMNRNVFKGLLIPTEIKVYEASSGEECITMLQEQKFDIIFLDHMMPGMDGIETFHIIKKKKLCEKTPVIMFTANVMIGEREKFLNIGFSDFLSKPIILDQLDEILIRYLPKELLMPIKSKTPVIKSDSIEKIPQIDEFDFGYAIGLLKGEDLLMQSLKNFKELLKYIPEKLNGFLNEIETEEGLKNYRIEVHALKGTSATVGALLLSKLARLLEVAAKEGKIEKIRTLHPFLIEEIEKHKERVSVLFVEEKQEFENSDFIKSYLDMFKIGLIQEDYDTVDIIMEEINKYQYVKEVQVLVDELSGQVLNMESENAIQTLERMAKVL